MLDTLTIQNFKAFEDVKVPLAPLTLIYGQNASGKTSVLEAIRIIGASRSLALHSWLGSRRSATSLLQSDSRDAEFIETELLDAYSRNVFRRERTRKIRFGFGAGPQVTTWYPPAPRDNSEPGTTALSETGLGQWSTEIADPQLRDSAMEYLANAIEVRFDFLTQVLAPLDDDDLTGDFPPLDIQRLLPCLVAEPGPVTRGRETLTLKPSPVPFRGTADVAFKRVTTLISDAVSSHSEPAEGLLLQLHDFDSVEGRKSAAIAVMLRMIAFAILTQPEFESERRSAISSAADDAMGGRVQAPPTDWTGEFAVVRDCLAALDDHAISSRSVNSAAQRIERMYRLRAYPDELIPPHPQGERSDVEQVLDAATTLVFGNVIRTHLGGFAALDKTPWAHIGPLRRAPEQLSASFQIPRQRRRDEDTSLVGEQGEDFQVVLHRHPSVLDELNVWLAKLGIPYEYVQESLVLEGMRAADRGRNKVEVNHALVDTRRPMAAGSDKRMYLSFEEVGFGVGQVLPIIVQLLAPMPGEPVVAIQQPELHIHPRLQTELADLLIEASRKDTPVTRKQVIVETHSEHLLLRVQRRLRETKDLPPDERLFGPEDVSVLFVDTDEHGRGNVQRIRLGDDGDFIDPWPGGFFAERLIELLSY